MLKAIGGSIKYLSGGSNRSRCGNNTIPRQNEDDREVFDEKSHLLESDLIVTDDSSNNEIKDKKSKNNSLTVLKLMIVAPPALIWAALSGGVPFVSMSDLGTGAASDLIPDNRNMTFVNSTYPPGTFLDTWGNRVFGNGEWYLGIVAAVWSLSAILAMSPFNAFFTFNDIYNAPENFWQWIKKVRKQDVSITISEVFDFVTAFIAQVLPGAPLAMFFMNGAMEMGLEDNVFLKFAGILAMLSTGFPIINMLKKLLEQETVRTVHALKDLNVSIGSGLCLKKCKNSFWNKVKIGQKIHADDAMALKQEVSTKPISTILAQLNTILYHSLNAVQLLKERELPENCKNMSDAEIIAYLLSLRVPEVKVAFVDIIAPLATIYFMIEGTFQFGIFGKKYLDALFGDTLAGGFKDIFAFGSQVSFCAFWWLLLKDAIFRPIVRMFSSNSDKLTTRSDSSLLDQFTNFGEFSLNKLSSWKKLFVDIMFAYSIYYGSGVILGVTNIPLLLGTDAALQKIICAILASAATSAKGLRDGLKVVLNSLFKCDHFDIHDKLTAKVTTLINRIQLDDDSDVRRLYISIIKERQKNINARENSQFSKNKYISFMNRTKEAKEGKDSLIGLQKVDANYNEEKNELVITVDDSDFKNEDRNPKFPFFKQVKLQNQRGKVLKTSKVLGDLDPEVQSRIALVESIDAYVKTYGDFKSDEERQLALLAFQDKEAKQFGNDRRKY